MCVKNYVFKLLRMKLVSHHGNHMKNELWYGTAANVLLPVKEKDSCTQPTDLCKLLVTQFIPEDML